MLKKFRIGVIVVLTLLFTALLALAQDRVTYVVGPDKVVINYPAGIDSVDANVRIVGPGGQTITLNFHPNTGAPAGTYELVYATHPNWPGWTVYEVQWVQVNGSNCHYGEDNSGRYPEDCEGTPTPPTPETTETPDPELTPEITETPTVEPTEEPTTEVPTEEPTTEVPTEEPTTEVPTEEPTTEVPTEEPTTEVPTEEPTTEVPTEEPTTEVPTEEPTTEVPTEEPTTEVPTEEPTTEVPTEEPTTEVPTEEPTTEVPTEEPTTEVPTEEPTTEVPTEEPTTEVPTEEPTTEVPTEEPEGTDSPDPEDPKDENVPTQNGGLICYTNQPYTLTVALPEGTFSLGAGGYWMDDGSPFRLSVLITPKGDGTAEFRFSNEGNDGKRTGIARITDNNGYQADWSIQENNCIPIALLAQPFATDRPVVPTGSNERPQATILEVEQANNNNPQWLFALPLLGLVGAIILRRR